MFVIDFIKRSAGKLLSPEWYEALVAYSILYHQFRPLLSAPKFNAKEKIWDYSAHTIGADRNVLFLEFGVWQGTSIHGFASRFPNAETRLWGFDSFEGLPEKWGTMDKGAFSTNGRMPQIKDPRIQLVKGWFHETFETGIQSARVSDANPDVVFVHFDADLYSSTLFLLNSLYRQFDQYYFLFDEFMSHECRALYNFQQTHPCTIEFLASSNSESPFPEQVLGKIVKK